VPGVRGSDGRRPEERRSWEEGKLGNAGKIELSGKEGLFGEDWLSGNDELSGESDNCKSCKDGLSDDDGLSTVNRGSSFEGDDPSDSKLPSVPWHFWLFWHVFSGSDTPPSLEVSPSKVVTSSATGPSRLRPLALFWLISLTDWHLFSGTTGLEVSQVHSVGCTS
jgi:hypothetical protein